ncbi:hypothetical protein P4O66_003655 [Electrophorus voltai]|uniref:Uncharacterized protein n=1 Tax=Electrophorus voltai TaxID=2609070 RepID=A0AAD9E563_9TELE|nr:hypothetical protein P4O66_003655 [Electrophorus voltai]
MKGASAGEQIQLVQGTHAGITCFSGNIGRDEMASGREEIDETFPALPRDGPESPGKEKKDSLVRNKPFTKMFTVAAKVDVYTLAKIAGSDPRKLTLTCLATGFYHKDTMMSVRKDTTTLPEVIMSLGIRFSDDVNVLLMTYKALSGLAPQYLSKLLRTGGNTEQCHEFSSCLCSALLVAGNSMVSLTSGISMLDVFCSTDAMQDETPTGAERERCGAGTGPRRGTDRAETGHDKEQAPVQKRPKTQKQEPQTHKPGKQEQKQQNKDQKWTRKREQEQNPQQKQTEDDKSARRQAEETTNDEV